MGWVGAFKVDVETKGNRRVNQDTKGHGMLSWE